MSKTKASFSAVFDHYEYKSKPNDIFNKILHCRNVRTSKGYIIKEEWALDEADLPEQLIGNVTLGEIIRFEADIEFKNIEISYPHGKLKENI